MNYELIKSELHNIKKRML